MTVYEIVPTFETGSEQRFMTAPGYAPTGPVGGAAVVAAADALVADAVDDIPAGDYRQDIRVARESLGARIIAGAAHVARTTYTWLRLVAEFDRREGYGSYVGIACTAHFLTWAAGVGTVAAREHVRVARALEKMPAISEAFAAGELSYSKVRECSRVIDLVDEAELLYLARGATAAQLERSVRAFRRGQADRLRHELNRHLTYSTLEDGSVVIRAELPPDDAAVVLAALQGAILHDKYAHATAAAEEAAEAPPPRPEVDPANITCAGVLPGTPVFTLADALVDVARGYLAAAPTDSSGADRDLVVVHLDAADLPPVPEGAGPLTYADEPVDAAPPPVPDGHPDPDPDSHPDPHPDPGPDRARSSAEPDSPATAPVSSRVPAGTCGADPAGTAALPRTISWWLSGPAIDGIGAVDTATARRILCNARHTIALFAPNGEVLHLGRDQRLASRAQRRALAARDRCCQFPGCTRVRGLEAHHTVWWSRGGATDIDMLLLLCRFHHVLTHTAELTITRRPAGGWRFTRIGGEEITPEHQCDSHGRRQVAPSGAPTHRPLSDQRLINTLLTDLLGPLQGIYRTDHPSAASMFPTWGGEPGSAAAEILFFGQALKEHRQRQTQATIDHPEAGAVEDASASVPAGTPQSLTPGGGG